MVNEIWKDIKDYPNYMVSNLGRVKSVNYNKTKKEKILKEIKIRNGYLYVNLCKNGKVKKHQVHRLVAQAFMPNPDNKPHIDHINTNRTDNRVENLRWCTNKENMNNPLTIIKISKPIIQFSKDGEFIKKWDCISEIQRELVINKGNICQCCKGNLKTAGGYIWRYYYKGIWLKNHIPLKDKLMSA